MSHESENRIATIARVHLGLTTLKPRKLDRLDFSEHACWKIHDALVAAYEAGRQSATSPKDVGLGAIVLTCDKPKDREPVWATGFMGTFAFSARVNAEHASDPSKEIAQSRITVLELRCRETGATIYAWDDGLECSTGEVSALLAIEAICTHLATQLFGPAID